VLDDYQKFQHDQRHIAKTFTPTSCKTIDENLKWKYFEEFFDSITSIEPLETLAVHSFLDLT
jgi:cyclopropane fatty-acyl-phospholipid synthase-like methyltransferase